MTERKSTLEPGSLQRDYLRMEYSGNYSHYMRFNEQFVQDVGELLGQPARAFVVKEGKVTRKRLHLSPSFVKGWNVRQLAEEESEIVEEDEVFELVINSGIIDSNIRSAMERKQGLGFYEGQFKGKLVEIIEKGVTKWLAAEVNEISAGSLNSDGYKLMRKRLNDVKIKNKGNVITFEAYPLD